MICRCEVVFRSRIYHGFVGNYGFIGFFRRKLFHFFACRVKSNVRNFEICVCFAIHYELHSQPRAIFRNFAYYSYLAAIPAAVPFRITHNRIGIAIGIACNVCAVRQERDLTCFIRYVFTDVFYVYRHFHTSHQFSNKNKRAFATCRTDHLQVTVYDCIAYVLFLAEIVDLVRCCEVVFRSRIYYGFVRRFRAFDFFGTFDFFRAFYFFTTFDCFGRFYFFRAFYFFGAVGFNGKFFHFFAYFVNSNICNLEVCVYFAIHYELHSQPRAIFRNFAYRSYFAAIPTAVPRRIADDCVHIAVCIARKVCAVR